MEDRLDIVRAIVDQVLDGALVVGPDDRVEHANADCERIFARDRASLVGATVTELFAFLPAAWRTAGTHTGSARRGTGTLEVRVAATPVGDRVVLTLQDRASAAPTPAMPDAVHDPQQMLWSIASAVDAFMFAGELSETGWYLPAFHGPGIEKLVGGDVAYEDANRVYDQCVHPEDYPAYEALYDVETRRAGEPLELEYRLRGLDGELRWVRERSVPRRAGDRTLLLGVVHDVTAEREARAELDRARSERLAAVARFERVVELANDLILAFDADGAIRFANPAAELLLGYPADRLLGAGWPLFTHPDDLPEVLALTTAAFGSRTEAPAVFRSVAADGSVVHVSWAGAHDDEDGVMFYVGRDVTAEMAVREEIERRSRTDALTDLANRRHVIEALTAELDRARRQGQPPGVLMVDLDHFKAVNDQFRHEAGDAVLRAVARRLRASVRRYDIVGRWGGEEFIVVVPGIADERVLRRIGEAVRRAVGGTPVPLPDERLIGVTASVGGALATDGLWSVEALVDAADRALFAAKLAGRDRVRLIGELSREEIAFEEPEALRLAQALALSASEREGTPEEHVREVAELAAAIAVELGLTADRVMRCRLGGWLHDVGKVAIPDSILTKPGPLDADEWVVMRTHAEIGERIVVRITGLAQTAPVVRHHHERWDGSGYPDGLAGESIPIEARVVAVADAYSGLTADRVYRPGLEEVDALEELRRTAGTHHDPRCVEALAALVEIGWSRLQGAPGPSV